MSATGGIPRWLHLSKVSMLHVGGEMKIEACFLLQSKLA